VLTKPEAKLAFDYAVVRVVPRVERGEFFNAGAILFCATEKYLRAKCELDRARLQVLAPGVEADSIEEHLEIIAHICRGGAHAGPIGLLEPRARFHWLVAPRSTVIQISPVHTGLCHNLEEALEHLMDKLVRPIPL
jgi:hypothetical protein